MAEDSTEEGLHPSHQNLVLALHSSHQGTSVRWMQKSIGTTILVKSETSQRKETVG